MSLKKLEGTLTHNNAIELNWVTAKEENFSHFEVQRSIHNKDFEVIGTVKGQGESNSDVSYNFTDNNAPYGIIRYRLNAIDIDESFEIFEAIEIKKTFSNQLKAYPNPFREITDLKIVVPEDLGKKLDKINLYNYSGKLIYTEMDYEPFNSQIVIGNLKAGMYILNITHNGLTESIRVIKE
ncbi:T9SS type A sorting domain-containing protein [Marivirga arenosa]|uniref:T9SS type A sorting domain-containing protein n=1 Tax=Marivirga arenosa TaxID=3059076 RepID=A0AA49JDV6_9BACT|nr:T9SS type A sorting domain-containing protein [Marivirga sp. ABR2-2]WKK85311.1 T9SS type A sorting domain-containing protein [Marivirga sp. ABR2-2]